MVAVASTSDEKVYCDCPKFHKGFVSIRTRRRHRKEASMIDHPDESPCQSQFQLDTVRNDGFPPGNDLSQSQIAASTMSKEADNDHAPPVHDFDDWPMDIDEGGDGGSFGYERTQSPSEDEGDSGESGEEDIDDTLEMLAIHSGEESAFEDEDGAESSDEELEGLDDHMHDNTDE